MWDVKGLVLTPNDAGQTCVLVIPDHIPGPSTGEDIFSWSSNDDGTLLNTNTTGRLLQDNNTNVPVTPTDAPDGEEIVLEDFEAKIYNK